MRAKIIRFPKSKRERAQPSKPRRRVDASTRVLRRLQVRWPSVLSGCAADLSEASRQQGMEPHLLFPQSIMGTGSVRSRRIAVQVG